MIFANYIVKLYEDIFKVRIINNQLLYVLFIASYLKTICYFYLLYVTILIGDGWVDDLDAHLNDATVTTPEMDEVEELDGFTFDMESNIKR